MASDAWLDGGVLAMQVQESGLGDSEAVGGDVLVASTAFDAAEISLVAAVRKANRDPAPHVVDTSNHTAMKPLDNLLRGFATLEANEGDNPGRVAELRLEHPTTLDGVRGDEVGQAGVVDTKWKTFDVQIRARSIRQLAHLRLERLLRARILRPLRLLASRIIPRHVEIRRSRYLVHLLGERRMKVLVLLEVIDASLSILHRLEQDESIPTRTIRHMPREAANRLDRSIDRSERIQLVLREMRWKTIDVDVGRLTIRPGLGASGGV